MLLYLVGMVLLDMNADHHALKRKHHPANGDLLCKLDLFSHACISPDLNRHQLCLSAEMSLAQHSYFTICTRFVTLSFHADVAAAKAAQSFSELAPWLLNHSDFIIIPITRHGNMESERSKKLLVVFLLAGDIKSSKICGLMRQSSLVLKHVILCFDMSCCEALLLLQLLLQRC